MKEITGSIECQEFYHALGGVERTEYRWTGGDLAWVSDTSIYHKTGIYKQFHVGDVFTVGPFRLRVIEENFFRGCYLVARDGWKAWLLLAAYRATHHLEFIYRRLVITAAVWGLAEFHQAIAPSWRDIYLLKRIAGWLERMKQWKAGAN